MDLRRLKTIFIFVLVAINIMFFALINNALNYEKEERRTMTESLTALLAKNMVYLPQKLELPDSPEISGFYIEKMFGSNEELVSRFLGRSYEETEQYVYTASAGTLYIEGDEFRFHNANPQTPVSDFSEENIQKVCHSEMKRLGIPDAPYIFGGVNFVDEGIRAIFTMQHRDDVFFDAYVSFDISEKGVTAVSGRNLVSELTETNSNEKFYSIISVLPDLVRNDRLEKNVAHTVVSIKSGYYIGSTAESYRNILAIPVWQIATDSGHILYYDARNGQFIDE
ncbi:MAG: hypothetical protein E7401_01200 [Ruminococcaceae bacterium]|nr:hypothetical protein [Oscillospiraceae bacterium]